MPSTSSPEYYKWTQYLFLQLYKAGLVHYKNAPVYYDPIDKTVLADEQIDSEGRSWRSGAIAELKVLKQWYIDISNYAAELYDNIDQVYRSTLYESRSWKIGQRSSNNSNEIG